MGRDKDDTFLTFLSKDVFRNFTNITEDNFVKSSAASTCPEGEPIDLKPHLRDKRLRPTHYWSSPVDVIDQNGMNSNS